MFKLLCLIFFFISCWIILSSEDDKNIHLYLFIKATEALFNDFKNTFYIACGFCVKEILWCYNRLLQPLWQKVTLDGHFVLGFNYFNCFLISCIVFWCSRFEQTILMTQTNRVMLESEINSFLRKERAKRQDASDKFRSSIAKSDPGRFMAYII